VAKNSVLGAKKYFLILGDIFILYFSLWLTLIIRYGDKYDNELWLRHLWPFTLVFLVWLVIFYIDDLYELNLRQGLANILSRIIRDILIGGILAIIFFYLGENRLFAIKPQTVLLINGGIAVISIYLWHIAFDSFIKLSKTNSLVIIGFNPLIQEVIEEIKKRPQLGFQLKHIIIEDNNINIPDNLKSVTIYDHFENLKNICLNNKINTIVSNIHPRDNNSLSKSLFDCLPLQINFFDIANFYEKITGKIPVTTIEQIWFLENLEESNKKFYERTKRVFDLILSFILFTLSLPFIPLIALIIKLSSKGKVFFTQIRVGKNGQTFKVIKFRTMFENAETNGPQWATTNDSRITKVGRLLRKTRIDEIPQLLNIIKNEMSIIGPRPERPEFIEQLQNQIPFYKERLLIKPGLTGWAQVAGPSYGGSKEESLEKLQYDLFYIKNRSLTLDLSILLKTIRIVLSRQGQ